MGWRSEGEDGNPEMKNNHFFQKADGQEKQEKSVGTIRKENSWAIWLCQWKKNWKSMQTQKDVITQDIQGDRSLVYVV